MSSTFLRPLRSGEGRLVDVRHPERVENNAAQFAMTREVCGEIGWQYQFSPAFLATDCRTCVGSPGIATIVIPRATTPLARSGTASQHQWR
jgi:hypothetical protein